IGKLVAYGKITPLQSRWRDVWWIAAVGAWTADGRASGPHETQCPVSTHFVARINIRAQSGPRSDIYVRRTYSGRPSSSIRFSEAIAMAASVICRPLVRERSASPITRL